ncbi:MAG: anthranilate synthase component I family protein [Epsilonproteobacteria bacterium]|nr:anthranilate synthase component I family protein [Campylobacterota bacterium]
MVEFRTVLFDQLAPIAIYKKVRELYQDKIILFFESAINTSDGNFSFIFIGARERITHKDGKSTLTLSDGTKKDIGKDPFLFLKSYYKKFDTQKYKKLSKEANVGFVDGFIGYIGYDAVKIFEPRLEKDMCCLKDELNIPDIELIRPEITIAFSHKTNKLTIISEIENRSEYFNEIMQAIFEPYKPMDLKKTKIDKSKGKFEFSKERFFKMVENSKEMIKSGDIFQIVLSNRFTQYAHIDKLSFYRILRSKNPSPYMYLLDFNSFSIIGSSPEVMVALKDGHILLRPIAGTRKRGDSLDKDLELELDMLNDEKERAEHLMLIDLGRNDVGKVAKPGSVKVKDMMRVEKYSHVMHMVSDVEGVLDDKYDMFDLFAATFTAGTMTGTPKIRAMELIAEFEGLKRSFYSGVVGYFGFDGNLDSAIAIRTSYLDDEKIVFQAGAGIVADSKKELEYLEVQNKLQALMSSLDDLSE